MFPISSKEQLRRSVKNNKEKIAAEDMALESGVLTEQQTRELGNYGTSAPQP